MATKVEVYPRPGETYPDAEGVAITSAGAIVWESKHIEDALRDGFLLTFDPYGVGLPEDRTEGLPPTEGAPGNAPYVLATAGPPELTGARVLAAGAGVSITDSGAGGTLTVSATAASGAPGDAQYLVTATHAGLSAERVLTAGAGITLTPSAGALTVSSSVTAPTAPGTPPPNVAAASSLGTPGAYATAQHTHGHGDQAGGSLHALATTTVPGFVSGAEKVKINAIPAAGAAPADADYIVGTATGALTSERVLTAGAGISITPGAGTMTVASTVAAGAPTDAEYLVNALSGGLSAERVLTAGAGVTLTPAAGALTVATPSAVQGPATATDNAVSRWDGTTGKLVQSSLVTIDDAGNIATPGTVDGVDVSNLATALANVAVPSYVTLAATPTLGNERILTAGAGISLTDGGAGGPVTIASTGGGGGAPADAEYLVSAASGGLSAERVLTAGAGITLTPGAGVLTIESTGGGGGGAPTDAEYLVSTASAGLSAERVLTAGVGVTLTPGAGTLTVATVNAVQSVTLSTDNAVTRWDGTTGKVVQSSSATLDDAGLLTTAGLSVAGDIAVTGTVDGVDIAGANFASYMTLGANTSLPNERTLLTTGGILVADGGPGASVTLSAPGLAAPFVTLASDSNLANERVLTAGAGITLTDGGAGGTVTVASTVAAGAPTDAEYLVSAASGGLSAERVLTAGANITLTPGAGTLTVASTAGGGGAPVGAQYLTLATDGTLTNERVLTAGTGVALTDGGAGGALTISQIGAGYNPQSGATYTLQVSDAGKLIGMSNGTPTTVTIPTDAVALFPVGSIVYVVQGGGLVTIAPAGGVSLFSPGFAPGGARTLRGVSAVGILFKAAANVWWVSGDLSQVVSTQGGTAYTPVAADFGIILSFNNASPITVTVPTNATAMFAIGTKLTLEQTGTGQVSITPAGGVTLNVPIGFVAKARAQFSEMVLTKVATDTWELAGDLEGAAALLLNNQTGTAYTLVLADAPKCVTMNNAAANTLTIPANASVAFPVGTVVTVMQLGVGQTTIAITTDTLNNPALTAKLRARYSVASLTKITATSWVLSGDLAAS
jgi:hypothetical protein